MLATARSPRRSLFDSALASLGWLVVAALGAVVFARIVAWDDSQLFAELDAAIEVLFLPAWLVLGVAAALRRPFLGAAAAALCVAQVIYVGPELLASSRVPAFAASAPTLRLFDANVQDDNPSMSGYATEIEADRPDVVALEETNPADFGELVAAGALDRFRYRYDHVDDGSRGFILASREPLGRVTVVSVDGLAYLLRSTLTIDGRTIAFWVVHTTAPTEPGVTEWNAELDGVVHELVSLHPRPLLMVGDFNATWGNRGFRAILSTGLIDAAAARGQPFAFTWSQRLGVVPPLIRIDHVLTSGDVAVTAIATHLGPGSEHRDLTATVAIGRLRVASLARVT